MSLTPSALHPGMVLADRVLTARLGSGGEGEVWEARQPDGGRCALKVIRPDVLPSAEEVRRRGAWLVRIDHPAMVRVTRGGRFTGGALAGWGFVEMDLVQGASLQSCPPLEDAVARLQPVAEALDLLHAGAWSDGVPLVHRDVKPGNLIATDAGLVLVDPSTLRGLDTRELTRVGTPAYVAPEVATGRFGPLVDVYSLGATAAALLTGRRGGALSQVLADPGAFELPEGVVRALSIQPAARPGTCAAVLADPDPGRGGQQGTGWSDAPGWSDSPGWSDGSGEAVGGDHVAAGAPAGPGWSIVALALLLAVPSAAYALALPLDVLGPVVAALHLVVHLLTGRLALGLLAPPWAWGDLLAGLAPDNAFEPRRRWLADVVAGVLLVGGSAVGVALVEGFSRWTVPAIVLVVIGLVMAALRSAGATRRVTWGLLWTGWLVFRSIGGIPRVLISGGRR